MLTVLLLASALQAASATSAAPPAPAEKKLCRRDVATGSIMARRTCHTRAEWARIDAAVARMTDETLRQRASAPSGLNN